jgi:hypothetical protein
MALVFYPNDPCPRCHKPTIQAIIERHPTRNDLAVHSFHCADCGPVKSKLISMKPDDKPPSGLAA